MRRADVYVDNEKAGVLIEIEAGKSYIFRYIDQYQGNQVSLTLPVGKQEYHFDNFPSFFDGLLPEGITSTSLSTSLCSAGTRPSRFCNLSGVPLAISA